MCDYVQNRKLLPQRKHIQILMIYEGRIEDPYRLLDFFFFIKSNIYRQEDHI